jgi:DNA-binding response OmpR family regulator
MVMKKIDNSFLRVALIEDDRLLSEEIVEHLSAHGFDTYAVNSAAACDTLLERTAVDLFVIDWNLPGESGLSLSTRIRAALPSAGILMMTARAGLYDRLTGYEQGGADVYLTKPVAPDELIAVLLRLGRRVKPLDRDAEWSLSLRERTLLGPKLEQKIRLTGQEITLLVALAQARENTLGWLVLCDLYSRDDHDHIMSKHALEEMVARLRKKFKAFSAEGAEPAIKAVRGIGYQLCIRVRMV